MVDQLIDAGIDYLHVSLTSVLHARPIGFSEGQTIASLILQHVNGRAPVIAAGQIKTAKEATEALALGLTCVAIGQALIINPDWVSLAIKGEQPEGALSPSKVPQLAIPEKLWAVIDAAKGWFPMTV